MIPRLSHHSTTPALDPAPTAAVDPHFAPKPIEKTVRDVRFESVAGVIECTLESTDTLEEQDDRFVITRGAETMRILKHHLVAWSERSRTVLVKPTLVTPEQVRS